jgi:hypothetical protein
MKKTCLLSVPPLVVIAVVALLGYGFKTSEAPELQKSQIIEIEKLSPIQISRDNSLGSLLFIQEATSREASNKEYTMLTGTESESAANTTFPDVSLINNSNKTIKFFALVVQSAADRRQASRFILKSNLSIAPNATYRVTSTEWLPAERETIQKNGQTLTVARPPGFNSPRAWLPGAASDLRVTVGMVEFDDNTKWKLPANLNW